MSDCDGCIKLLRKACSELQLTLARTLLVLSRHHKMCPQDRSPGLYRQRGMHFVSLLNASYSRDGMLEKIETSPWYAEPRSMHAINALNRPDHR